MTSFDSMKNKLNSLGVYNITQGSNIYNELKSYAVALDEHRNFLDEILRENFISTAETYGIEKREEMVGNKKDVYALDKRREMLIFRNSLGIKDFTLAGVDKLLTSLGISDYQITERYNYQHFVIHIGGDYNDVEQEWIRKQINLILPAHLRIYVYFMSISWSYIDYKGFTFQYMDNKNYTWETINNLK